MGARSRTLTQTDAAHSAQYYKRTEKTNERRHRPSLAISHFGLFYLSLETKNEQEREREGYWVGGRRSHTNSYYVSQSQSVI